MKRLRLLSIIASIPLATVLSAQPPSKLPPEIVVHLQAPTERSAVPKEFAPIFGAIAGGVLALMGGAVQQRSSRSAERRRAIREKLEEMYLLTEQLETWANNTVGAYVRAFVGGENAADNKDPEKSPIIRLTMLGGIYAPTVRPQIRAVYEAAETLRQNAFNAFLTTMKLQRKLTDEEFRQHFGVLDEVRDACSALREQLETLAPKFL